MIKLLLSILLTIIIISMITIIIINHYRKNTHYKSECKTNNDCEGDKRCVYDPEMKKKACVTDSKFCGIELGNNLMSCNPGPSPGAEFDCGKCSNSLPWTCHKVKWGNPQVKEPGTNYTIGKAVGIGVVPSSNGTGMIIEITKVNGGKIINGEIKITNPGTNFKKNDVVKLTQQNSNNDATIILDKEFESYNFTESGKPIVIPETNTGWCLPNISQNPCNIFTSDAILEKTGKDSYEWACQCRNPSMFDHDGEGDSTCEFNKTCSSRDDLHVLSVTENGTPTKSCTTNADCSAINGICCSSDGNGGGSCLDNTKENIDKYCYVPWENQKNSDPSQGICICSNKGDKFINSYTDSYDYSKICAKDSCTVGGKGKSGGLPGDTCKCNSGYLSCGGTGKPDIDKTQKQCNTPQCIYDPCLPYGKYINGGCECFKNLTDANNYNPTLAKYNENCVEIAAPNWAHSATKILCDKTELGYPCPDDTTCKVQRTNPSPGGGPIAPYEWCDNCPCPTCNAGYCTNSSYDNEKDCTSNKGSWIIDKKSPNCKGPAVPYCTGNNGKLCFGDWCVSDDQCCGDGKCEWALDGNRCNDKTSC